MATYMMLLVGAMEHDSSVSLTADDLKQIFESVPEPWRHTARIVLNHIGNMATLDLVATMPDTCPDQFHDGWATLERVA